MTSLNERAHQLCDAMVADADQLGIAVSTLPCGTRLIDCGVKSVGSIEAGLQLARICLAGLGTVDIVQADPQIWDGQAVLVASDDPVAACMASQYAGWEIKGDKFFAMGSGPMRAAACREELFQDIGRCEKPEVCVGVLETAKLPSDDVCIDIATKCGITPARLTLLAARTSSIAGTVQIVAHSVETALHKMHSLGFDLNQIEAGVGNAPIPPAGGDDMSAIGRTNDSILYGGCVSLLVSGDDDQLRKVAERVPSSTSPDYGRPFAEIFARYEHDFYRIDPLLFSPAVISITNAGKGAKYCHGRFAPDVLAESFAKK